MVCHARPPSTLQEFLEEAAALSRAGRIATRWALPTSFGALRAALAMAERHREMARPALPADAAAVRAAAAAPAS